MIELDFKESNFTYRKPAHLQDDECCDLRVFKGNTVQGYPCIVSVWYANKEDLEALNAGKPIYLTLLSNEMPPVSMQTENPFEP